LKQKNPLDDVPLTNGEGMMTNQARYKSYLAHPVVIPQVSLSHGQLCPWSEMRCERIRRHELHSGGAPHIFWQGRPPADENHLLT